MLLAHIEGNLTATRKHPSLNGWRLLICQPTSSAGIPEGTPVVAIDPLGAGLHQTVIISTDGAAARMRVNDPLSPVRMMIVGIVDEISETKSGAGFQPAAVEPFKTGTTEMAQVPRQNSKAGKMPEQNTKAGKMPEQHTKAGRMPATPSIQEKPK